MYNIYKERLLFSGSVESNSTEGSDSLTSNQILNCNQTILKNGGPGPSDQVSFNIFIIGVHSYLALIS